jgi:hypothetical protein
VFRTEFGQYSCKKARLRARFFSDPIGRDYYRSGILTALAAAVIVKLTFREQTPLNDFLTGIL